MSPCCLALSATLLIAAASSAPAAPSGEELFSAHGCQSCHRIGRIGGNTGPDLSFVGIRRTGAWLDRWLENPQAWKHSTLMPNLRLPKNDRDALVRYLSERKGQDYGDGPRPWEGMTAEGVAKGARIYRIAGCVACHGIGGAGGEPNVNTPGGAIPALRVLVSTYTPEELIRKIRRGSVPIRQDPSGPEPVAMPAWSAVLDGGEIEALVAYLRTFQSSAEDRSF